MQPGSQTGPSHLVSETITAAHHTLPVNAVLVSCHQSYALSSCLFAGNTAIVCSLTKLIRRCLSD